MSPQAWRVLTLTPHRFLPRIALYPRHTLYLAHFAPGKGTYHLVEGPGYLASLTTALHEGTP
jgi:hypothetical protein